MLDIIVSTTEQYYGAGSGIRGLKEYIATGDITKITRQNGARESLQYISKDDIFEYLESKNKIIENIISIMDECYGSGAGIETLKHYIVEKNDLIITRQNRARESLKNISILEIKEYLTLKGIKY